MSFPAQDGSENARRHSRIAGVYQHADPRTVLGHPVVSREEASKAVDECRERLSSLLYEDPVDFDSDYPLMHDANGDVIQRHGLDDVR